MSNLGKRERAATACLVGGAGFLLLGLYLVHKAGDTTSGSPFGWLFIVVGIVGLLSVLAVMAGAYDRY